MSLQIDYDKMKRKISEIVIHTNYQYFIAPPPDTAEKVRCMEQDAIDMYLGKSSNKYTSLQANRFHHICQHQILLILRAVEKSIQGN